MSVFITEALLEIYFHQAQVKYFEKIFGARFLRLLKPSPQREAWVGFDQGWVRISVSDDEIYTSLREAIQSNANSVGHFYLGYFLQFKIVQRVRRRNDLTLPGYPVQYLRSELSLKPNKATALSQHETLLRLSQINFSSVCYACPMVFDIDVYQEADLSLLRCVDVLTAPPGWVTNQRHFITFRSENDSTPLWCSQPVEGKALSFEEWASPDSKIGPKKLSAQEIITLLETAHEKIISTSGRIETPLFKQQKRPSTKSLPDCLTIIEFREKILPPRVKPSRMIRVDD